MAATAGGNGGKLILNNIKLDYWKDCWKNNRLIWHMEEAHPFLQKLQPTFKPNSKVFVPLCGKTKDLVYLADNDHSVVGVEYTKKGIEDFFSENSLRFKTYDMKEKNCDFKLYEAVDKDIKIFNGNFFQFPSLSSNDYDVIWDRASFVAMHPSDRGNYTSAMRQLVAGAGSDKARRELAYFLEVFEFDQRQHGGPPFVVPRSDVDENFGRDFDIELLYETESQALREILELDRFEVKYYQLKAKN